MELGLCTLGEAEPNNADSAPDNAALYVPYASETSMPLSPSCYRDTECNQPQLDPYRVPNSTPQQLNQHLRSAKPRRLEPCPCWAPWSESWKPPGTEEAAAATTTTTTTKLTVAFGDRKWRSRNTGCWSREGSRRRWTRATAWKWRGIFVP